MSFTLYHADLKHDAPPPGWSALDGGSGSAGGTGTPDLALVALEGETPAARCALYFREGLTGAPGLSGLIGLFEAGSVEAGAAVLSQAVERAAGAGCRRVLGPMNGSTWHRYRLALPNVPDGAIRPTFLGEPVNPPYYPDAWDAAGLARVAHYESAIVTTPPAQSAPHFERLLAAHAFSVASLDRARFDQEIRDVYDLSLLAFADNLYYSPIDSASFGAMYQGLRDRLDPALVRLVRDGTGRLLAFLFAYPDPLAPLEAPRIIAKTLATHPEARGLGLGSMLLAHLNHEAHRRGGIPVIHALMYAENASRRISERVGGEVFRRYALWGKEL